MRRGRAVVAALVCVCLMMPGAAIAGVRTPEDELFERTQRLRFLLGGAAQVEPALVMPAAIGTADLRWLRRAVTFGMLTGRPGEGLALDAPMTRAEFAVVLVRAFGQEERARGRGTYLGFADVMGHWSEGYVAVADELMQLPSRRGLNDSPQLFHPDAPLTVGEMAEFLTRALIFTQMDRPGAITYSGPLVTREDYLAAALETGVVSAADREWVVERAASPISRGAALQLADRAFFVYRLRNGRTVYTTYLDPVAPEIQVTRVSRAPGTAEVELTGTVDPDVTGVWVGTASTPALLGRESFSARVTPAARDARIPVAAADLAGNITVAWVEPPDGAAAP